MTNGSCWAVMCSVIPLLLFSSPLPLLCYRVTEHIIDDGPMGHDGSMNQDGSWVTYTMSQMGHGSRKVTHGPLWFQPLNYLFKLENQPKFRTFFGHKILQKALSRIQLSLIVYSCCQNFHSYFMNDNFDNSCTLSTSVSLIY